MLLFFRKQIIALQANGKLGTAHNYQSTLNSFSAFLGGTDILFSRCNEELIHEYDIWLQKGEIARNTRSFYMRILRSVYNKAVSLHFARQPHPFQHVYTGVDRTRKRAVSEETIIQLQKLVLRSSASLTLARDIFIFSYTTRGMAFIDIAFLRKENIANGTIVYTRHKTGQKLTILIEPCMAKIIVRYLKDNTGSPYLFPLITSTDPVKSYTQYQSALGYYNRRLKRLGELIGLDVPLTSYCARHTWATAARNHNIPLSVISAGMGHVSEKTTQIYLASLDTSVIDQANREILGLLDV